MRKFIMTLLIAALPGLAAAAGGGAHLDEAPIDLTDKASLQNGAKLFVNYCLGCHSAKYMRYNRMGQDLGLTDDQIQENFLFLPTQKVGDTMDVALPEDAAEGWFGVAPPDLSVTARARGADWLYTYFRSFYVDESRPYGVNNVIFKDVGMPHVLWQMEGLKKPVYETEKGSDGKERKVIADYEMVVEGSMTPAEYDEAMGDLVNFLVYMGEPVRLERQQMGIWVLVFLGVFFVFAYLLKKEYWKDVH